MSRRGNTISKLEGEGDTPKTGRRTSSSQVARWPEATEPVADISAGGTR